VTTFDTANEACEVPLVEQLRGIPRDYRTSREIQWAQDGTPTGHQFIPVGFMMHRAANRIAKLEAAWQAACAFIDSHAADTDITADMRKTYAEFQQQRALLGTRSDDD